MSGIRLLHGINREHPDRVDAQLVDSARRSNRFSIRSHGVTHRKSPFGDRDDAVGAKTRFEN
jgi:hypothetical protein